MAKHAKKYIVPKSLADLYASMFGRAAKFAEPGSRSRAELKKLLRQIADELFQYFQANVQTDGQHFFMVCAALSSAAHALENDEDFWPGYCTGITRLALLLMGNVPEHRRRKSGRKNKEHYSLNAQRSVFYSQNPNQKVSTLFRAHQFQAPKLSKSFNEYMSEFRNAKGFGATYKHFVDWFRETYPKDYCRLF